MPPAALPAAMAPPRALLAALALLAAGATHALLVADGQGAPSSDLQVTATAPGTPRVGQTANVTAMLFNAGPEAAHTFTVVFGWNNTTAGQVGNVTFPGNVDNFTAPGGGPPGDCLTPTGGLSRNCTVVANLPWSPSASQAGAGSLAARVVLGLTNSDPAGHNNEASSAAFVTLHQLALSLDHRDDRAKTVRPGEAAFYRVGLTNQGNARENVSLGASSAWTATLAGNGVATPAAALQVAVERGATASLLVLVRAPPGASGSATATLTANSTAASSLGGASLALPSTQASAGAAPSFGLASAGNVEGFAEPGGTADLGAVVRNTGGSEDALHWTLTSLVPAGWNASLLTEWAGLDAPAEALSSTVLRAQADAGLPQGAQANITLQAAGFNGGGTATVNVTLHTPAPDLVLLGILADRQGFPVSLDEAPAYQGDTARFRADVRNNGSLPLPKPTRFVIEGQQGGQTFLVADQVLATLVAGEGRTLFADWPTGNLTGNVTLTARLDPDGAIGEVREGNNDLQRSVVVRIPGLNVTAPATRGVLPGEHVRLAGGEGITVRNTGNAAERVAVRVRSGLGWTDTNHTLDLAPGAAALLETVFDVPALPGTLADALSVEARLANRSATVATAAVNLSVLDSEPPALESLSAPANVALGHAARFQAVLRDAVGVRSAEVLWRASEGDARAQAMESHDGRNWTASVVMTRPGPVSYWLRAVDRTPSNRTLDTSSTPGALVVNVGGVPLVELLEPANHSTVRAGTPIRLRLSDTNGIASVSVREGDRVFELASPYVLNTTGWAEGEHVLEVTARNGFGNEASAHFVFRVDNTPPLVRDARVAPERAGVGQNLHVEARASSDAVRGAVVVKRGSEVLREVPASVGLGLVNADLNLTEPGRYVLGVRVEDEAGNAASTNLDVEVAGGSVPAPWPLALAALALAAAARRRR